MESMSDKSVSQRYFGNVGLLTIILWIPGGRSVFHRVKTR